MTYSEFRTEFIAEVNRRDLTTTLAGVFIRDGIARLNEDLRIREMETSVSSVVHASGGYRTITVPSDYLATVRVVADDMPDELSVVPYGTLLRYDAQVGYPIVYARRTTSFHIRPYASASATLDYYAQVGALSADSDTNVVLAACPHILRLASKVFAAEYYKMDTLGTWEGHYQAVLATINQRAIDADWSGGTMQTSSMYGETYS